MAKVTIITSLGTINCIEINKEIHATTEARIHKIACKHFNVKDISIIDWSFYSNKKIQPVKNLLDTIVEDNKELLKPKSFYKKNDELIKGDYKTPFEKLLISFMDENFGTNPMDRFNKLNEEFNEVMDAYAKFHVSSNENTYDNLRDELSDLQAVLSHICSLFDLSHQQAIIMAHKKSTIRLTNPMYKRDGKK